MTAHLNIHNVHRQTLSKRRQCVVVSNNSNPLFELRICTNKTCKRQGSLQITQFAKDLALDEINVTTSGCLGQCGNGPNAVIIPLNTTTTSTTTSPILNQPLFLSHLTTPARLSTALSQSLPGIITIDTTLLKSTELRLAGNAAARSGNLQLAIDIYTQALELPPSPSSSTRKQEHLLYSNRSGTHLALGNADQAVKDAQLAVQLGPPQFTTSSVRLADALYALGRVDEAIEALDMAAERWPEFKSTSEYKQLTGELIRQLKLKKR